MEGGSQELEERRMKLKFAIDQKAYQGAYCKCVKRKRVNQAGRELRHVSGTYFGRSVTSYVTPQNRVAFVIKLAALAARGGAEY